MNAMFHFGDGFARAQWRPTTARMIGRSGRLIGMRGLPTLEWLNHVVNPRPLGRTTLVGLAPVVVAIGLMMVISAACGGPPVEVGQTPEGQLVSLIRASHPDGLAAYTLPTELSEIPQDNTNPLTPEKVELGGLLFHETGLASAGNNPGLAGTWSCASCHDVAAGFKAGVPQGIGEGGTGTGPDRVMSAVMDTDAPAGDPHVPDIQPVASPSILNTAFQDVMLWNGQFGNRPGSINAEVATDRLFTDGTPKAHNRLNLSGLETQAVAGLGVHRQDVYHSGVLAFDPYEELWTTVFGPLAPTETEGAPAVEEVAAINAGLAIAAWERTVLATEAPFQRWLRGEDDAMTDREIEGALVFFGAGRCADCHTGPALSSPVGSLEPTMFMAVGFDDFDTDDARVHGTVPDADRLGRGGLTGEPDDDYQFKIPQLYNLADADVFGHGASFDSIRAVVEYKNAGVPQNPASTGALDPRFTPLGLSEAEIDALVAFLTTALHDPDLDRYVPDSLPTGRCFPNADDSSLRQLGCS